MTQNKFLLVFLTLSLNLFAYSSSVSANPILKCGSSKECQSLFENTARKFLGAHYGYGSSNGKTFDCSGLVLTVINSLVDKASLPRNSQAMYSSLAQNVSLDQARRGDLVFFNTGHGVSHVGMYWGKDPKGNSVMYHSSSSKGVELRPINTDKYWMSRLVGVKRFVPLYQALSSVNTQISSEKAKPTSKEINKKEIAKETKNKNTAKSPSSEKTTKTTQFTKAELAAYTEYDYEPVAYEDDMYETAYYYEDSYKVSYEDETEYYEEDADYEYEVASEE